MVCTSRFRGERTRGLSKADSLRRRMSGLDTRAAFRRLALQQQEEKIRDMEDRIARLQKELEESSRQIASLQAGSDETTRARRSAQRNVNNSRREETRLADQNPSPEPRFYQTVRSTSVFEEPSASSRKVGSIGNGSRVRVVGSTGDWLEVRSKQGRPPGFIRRDDAVLMK